MPTYYWTLSKKSGTANSLIISVLSNTGVSVGEDFIVSAELNGSTVATTTVTTPDIGSSVDATLTGLSPNTTYTITGEHDGQTAATSITAATEEDDTPRTATQAQWEDLANRVKNAGTGNATITMSSTDPGEGSPLPANNYIAVYGTPPEFDYSTSEINTGIKWINGSYIYKKTIDTGALPNAGETNTPHNITNLSKVIKMEGYAYRSTDSKFIPLPFAGITSYNTTVDMSVVSGNIRLYVATDMSAFGESYITLYYTKSA